MVLLFILIYIPINFISRVYTFIAVVTGFAFAIYVYIQIDTLNVSTARILYLRTLIYEL